MVKFLDPEGEIVTCGSPYKFAMLKSLEISHLGKTLISPIGQTNYGKKYGVGKRIDEATSVKSFRHRGEVLLDILQKQYQAILQKKLKKTRASDILQF